MTVTDILDIIKRLKVANADQKRDILQSALQSDIFKRFTVLTYNPYKVFHISKVSPVSKFLPTYPPGISLLEAILSELEWLSKQHSVTHSELSRIKCFAKDSDHLTFINLILNKSWRCGVSAKTINAVYPHLVPVFPYHGCKSITDYANLPFDFPAIVQLKADGLFVALMNGRAYSRKGRQFLFENTVVDISNYISGYALLGEALLGEPDKPMDRAKANAELNKSLKNHRYYPSLHFQLWDAVPLPVFYGEEKSTLSYFDRFQILKSFVDEYPTANVHIIPSKVVYSISQAEKFAEDWVSKGFEGAILKSFDNQFMNRKSKYQLKMKVAFDIDLEVIGYNESSIGSKYADIGAIGSLQCRSSCNKLHVSVGSGLTDALRKDPPEIGSIVTVKHFGISQNQKTGVFSLTNPRFIEVRYDKDEADTVKFEI